MGKEIAEHFPCAMKIFDKASEALGFDVKEMIWNGDQQTLDVYKRQDEIMRALEEKKA